MALSNEQALFLIRDGGACSNTRSGGARSAVIVVIGRPDLPFMRATGLERDVVQLRTGVARDIILD